MFKRALANKNLVAALAAATAVIGLTGPANALLFDQNITPDVIFGSGNANGAFTVDANNGVELGLRAKIPFVGTTNSNGDGTYSFSLAETDHDSNAATARRWNFDFTVNTDTSGSSGLKIADFTYRLGIDFDPSQGTDFLEFDPITPLVFPFFFDHSMGDNSTANGAGVEVFDPFSYAINISTFNVLQQSWRHAFFPLHPTLTYDPDIDGTYDIFLAAFDDDDDEVARTQIQVIIGAGGAPVPPTSVSEPASLALFGLGLAALGYARRRRQI